MSSETQFDIMELPGHKYYSLPVFGAGDGKQYAYAANEKDANEACKEYIMGSLWAFNPRFVAAYCARGVGPKVIELLQNNCEESNDAIKSLIGERIGDFIKDAIYEGGRGHFLSCYDGEERAARDIGLDMDGFAYRID